MKQNSIKKTKNCTLGVGIRHKPLKKQGGTQTMYDIKKGNANVGGIKFPVYKREICSANQIEVVAGTNGYHGGDSGHGSRTFIQIRDLGGTDITVNKLTNEHGDEGVCLDLGGDAELQTIIEGLEFIVNVLKTQSKGNNI